MSQSGSLVLGYSGAFFRKAETNLRGTGEHIVDAGRYPDDGEPGRALCGVWVTVAASIPFTSRCIEAATCTRCIKAAFR